MSKVDNVSPVMINSVQKILDSRKEGESVKALLARTSANLRAKGYSSEALSLVDRFLKGEKVSPGDIQALRQKLMGAVALRVANTADA